MAPLTWRNVDAPNFSGVDQSLRTASALLNSGSTGLADALARFSASAQAGDSSAAAAAALGYSDGSALNGANIRNLSPQALQFIAGRKDQQLVDDSRRAGIAGQGIQNNQAQFNLDQGKSAADRAESYRANQPAANALIAQARALAETGTAESIVKARDLLSANTDTFTKAGMNASDIINSMSGNVSAGSTGMDMGQKVVADKKFYQEQGRQENQRAILDTIVNNPAIVDLPGALSAVSGMEGLDAKTRAALSEDLTANFQKYKTPPSVLDALPSRGQSPTQILQSSQSGGTLPPTFQAGLDRFEGEGNYDTLYGNAQNRGRFAGTSVSNMTVGQAIDFARSSGYGKWVQGQTGKDVATPMGRHQIVGSTLASAAKQMGLDPNTPFDARTQDAVALHIAQTAISGPRTMAGKIDALRGQWVGLKNASDAQVAQMVSEIEGKPAASASAPLDPSQIRNSVVDNGGAPLGTTGNASSILGAFTGSGYQAPQAVPVSGVTSPVAADLSSNNSSNTAATPAATSSDKSPAERNAELLGSLKKVGDTFEDTNGVKFKANSDGTFTQVDTSGIPTGGEANYQPQALAQTRPTASVPTTASGATAASTALSPLQMLQNVQTVANTGTIDQLSNPIGSLTQELATRPNRGKSFAEIVDDTTKATGAPKEQVIDTLNQVMRDNNVDADVAGTLAKQAVTTGTAGSWWGAVPFNGINFFNDRYGGAEGGGLKTTRLDAPRASELLKNFRTQGSNQAGANAPGVAVLNTAQGQQQAQAQVQLLAAQSQALVARVQALAVALQRDPNNADIRTALQDAQSNLAQVNSSLNTLNQQGAVAPYAKNNVAQPTQ